MNMDVRLRVSAGVPDAAGQPGESAMHFDAGFLTRLKQRDPETCTFLVTALTPVLDSRLRYRLRDHSAIEDIRNETFYRVFRLVDGGRVRQPEQLGSFVRGVCDRVAQECQRKSRGMEPLPAFGMDPCDSEPHLDEVLIDNERRALVWREVNKLPEADRRLILELHCEERDRREMARERGIGQTGLNVRLCRALKRLRAQIEQTPAAERACRPCPIRPPVKPPRMNRWATMAA